MKIRRKPDGSRELVSNCPLCGSKANYELNLSSRKYHCWACGYGGRLPAGKHLSPAADLAGQDNPDSNLSLGGKRACGPGASLSTNVPTGTRRPLVLTDIFPDFVQKEWERRGFDAQYIHRRFHPQWDGERICWKVYGGGPWRRGIFPWQTPKVLTTGQKGLLAPEDAVGIRGKDVVLVEGDYKAVSIPLPWVGVGIGGTTFSTYQKALLQALRPASVSVLLDAGKDAETEALYVLLRPTSLVLRRPSEYNKGILLRAREGAGPDDLPRRDLVELLRGFR